MVSYGIAGNTRFFLTGTEEDVAAYLKWREPKEMDYISMGQLGDFILQLNSPTVCIHTAFTGLPPWLKQFEHAMEPGNKSGTSRRYRKR